MEFKDVVKKIMMDEELKSQLQSLDSFDEVYGFFKANGYEGSKKELKNRLFSNDAPFKKLSEDDLENVAGGVSGRQVLAACAGIMMLTNTFGTLNMDTGASAMSPPTASSSIKSYGNEISKLSREQLLRLEELFALITTLNLYRSYMPDISDKSDSKSIYAAEFLTNEFSKCFIEFFEILSGEDHTDCKSKLDKFLSSADFKNFNPKEFHQKREELLSRNGFPQEKVEAVANVLENGYVQYEVLHKSPLNQSEKDKILKSVSKFLDGYNKVLSDVTGKVTAQQLKDSCLEIIKNSFSAMYFMPDR